MHRPSLIKSLSLGALFFLIKKRIWAIMPRICIYYIMCDYILGVNFKTTGRKFNYDINKKGCLTRLSRGICLMAFLFIFMLLWFSKFLTFSASPVRMLLIYNTTLISLLHFIICKSKKSVLLRCALLKSRAHFSLNPNVCLKRKVLN